MNEVLLSISFSYLIEYGVNPASRRRLQDLSRWLRQLGAGLNLGDDFL